MTAYRYTGRDRDGHPVDVTVEAPSVSDVVVAAQASGHRVHQIQTARSGGRFSWSSGTLSTADLTLMTEQLGTLTASGVPLGHALRELARESRRGRLRNLLERAEADVSNGESLEAALARQGASVPPLYLSLVRVGERTGNLPAVLQQLSVFGQRYQWVRYRVQIALAYPLFLLVAMAVFLAVFVTRVMGQFEDIYSSFDRDLPGLTSAVLVTGRWMTEVGLPVIGLMLGMFFILAVLFRLGYLRQRLGMPLERLKLRLPILGAVFQTVASARFFRALSMLLEHGVPIVESLHLAGLATGSPLMAETAQEAAEAVAGGEEIGAVLKKSGVFRRTHTWMMLQGERSQDFPAALDRLAATCEREAEALEKHSLSFVGPMAIAFCGVLVAIGVVACFLPIFHFPGLLQ